MEFQEEFYASFGNKYQSLQLKEVVVKKREGACTITFLYPSTAKELSDIEKQEITNWLRGNLALEKIDLKVKFMRVFVEEKLILKALQNFFEKRYKLITAYVNVENFKVKITNIDVIVDIDLTSRMIEFFAQHKIIGELSKFLKDNFLVDFSINLNEDKDLVDEVDIENVQMKTAYRLPQRYSVEVVKDLVGFGITPKPEYLSFINGPKDSVIVAGFIKKFERKDYVAKSGRHVGEQKTFFSFSLSDGKGKIDCIYFSSKRNVAVMEELQECDYVLAHGDVKVNQLGKLCLYIDKLALATQVEVEEPLPTQKDETPLGPVVEIEKLTALEQDSMFELQDKYNSKIMGKTIVVFDIETTGLDSENDQIIELGAVKIENGNIIEKFSSFVKPTKRIPFEVVELTGITEDMVADAPPIELVIKEFFDFTRGCVLSGHNVINFDIKFVRREGANLGLDFDNPIIDTMKEAQSSRLLKITRFNLSAVVKALGLTLEGAHRAWNDAYATAQVLLKLNEA